MRPSRNDSPAWPSRRPLSAEEPGVLVGPASLSYPVGHARPMWRRVLAMSCPTCAKRCAGACANCWEGFPRSVTTAVPLGLDALWCRYAYAGPVAHLVLAAKATPAHGWLDAMGRSLPEPGPSAQTKSCVVTWATGSRAHRRARGYDPAERLARSYARRHGLRVAELLERHGGPQAGRTAQERALLRFVARAPRGAEVVFLVDDVVTTGVTMSRAAVALRDAGVPAVIGVCFARRELRGASEVNGTRESGILPGGAVYGRPTTG